MATLMIVCGLPGAGKTTLATELERRHDAVRLCADEWMQALAINLWDERARAKIEALQWSVAQQLLALGAAVELHYVTAPVDVLFERLQRRAMEAPADHARAARDVAFAFEVPTADELAVYDSQSLTS
jgi:predicted kinase